MPEDKDNIIKFAPKAEKELDPKKQLQKELLERLAEGSRNLHQQMKHDHAAYYFIVIIMMITLISWAAFLE